MVFDRHRYFCTSIRASICPKTVFILFTFWVEDYLFPSTKVEWMKLLGSKKAQCLLLCNYRFNQFFDVRVFSLEPMEVIFMYEKAICSSRELFQVCSLGTVSSHILCKLIWVGLTWCKCIWRSQFNAQTFLMCKWAF